VLNTGSSFTLTATVHNASNDAVAWSVVQADGTNLPVVITVDARKMFADEEND
jgi:hypothetical protein